MDPAFPYLYSGSYSILTTSVTFIKASFINLSSFHFISVKETSVTTEMVKLDDDTSKCSSFLRASENANLEGA